MRACVRACTCVCVRACVRARVRACDVRLCDLAHYCCLTKRGSYIIRQQYTYVLETVLCFIITCIVLVFFFRSNLFID